MSTKKSDHHSARLRHTSRRSDLEGQQHDDGKASKGLSKKKQQGKHTVLYIGIILYAALRFLYRFLLGPQTFISCDDDQHLVKIQHDFLSEKEYQDLVQCTLQHPRLHGKNALNDGAFSNTKGFVVKFNSQGVSRFVQHPDYADCFGSLFERLRLPDTNAFVFNALVCEPFPLTEQEISLKDYTRLEKKTAVGLHLDQTVGMDGSNRHDFLAHQVNVMYVDVPEDMVGGSLELWRYGDWRSSHVKYPHETVKPSKNTMVAFRGDSYHQVKAYHSNLNSTARLSLVLEQYKIRNGRHAAKTIEWAEEFKQENPHS